MEFVFIIVRVSRMEYQYTLCESIMSGDLLFKTKSIRIFQLCQFVRAKRVNYLCYGTLDNDSSRSSISFFISPDSCSSFRLEALRAVLESSSSSMRAWSSCKKNCEIIIRCLYFLTRRNEPVTIYGSM